LNSTFFSNGRKSENLPKRTWKGEHARVPCKRTNQYGLQMPASRKSGHTIFLFYNNDINGPAEGGRIN
jgi:hypothetical protein